MKHACFIIRNQDIIIKYYSIQLCKLFMRIFFLANRAIPIIAFYRVESIYIYILVSLAQLCIVYV